MTAATQPTQVHTGVVMTDPVKTVKGLRQLISERWKTMEAILPKHMTAERYAGLIISAAAKNSDVFDCTAESLLNVIYQAASLGLEINAATGESYIIPFKDRRHNVTLATLVPGYKGLVKLAIQSREVSSIEARLVYEGEEKTFGVFYGTNSRIEHVPNFSVKREPAKVIFGYAVAKLPSGGFTFEVMTRQQLEAIRLRSPGRDNGPWKTDPEEMYRKTVTRRLCKYLPMSPQLAEAIELSDRAEIEEDDRSSRSTGGAQALNAALQVTAGPAQPIPVPETEAEKALRLADDAVLAAADAVGH